MASALIPIIETAAFACALVRFNKIRPSPLRWIVFPLAITCIVEWGSYFHLTMIRGSNNWSYTLNNIVFFCFFSWLYYHIYTLKKNRQIVLYSITGWLVFQFINIFFIQGIIFFNSYSYLLGCIMMIIYAFIYFREKMSVVSLEPISQDPFFWLTSGVLLFYAGEFILFSFFQYYLDINKFAIFRPIFRIFSPLLNIVFYSCIIISLWMKPISRNK